MEKEKSDSRTVNVRDLWDIFGDFGHVEGEAVASEAGFVLEAGAPSWNPALEYTFDGRKATGAMWMEQGVEVETVDFQATELRFSEL